MQPSLDELRDAADGRWTLANDEAVLSHLRQLSASILQRTVELQGRVASVAHEAAATDARVHNVFNSFLSLSSTQFVENVRPIVSPWPCIGPPLPAHA